MKRLGRLVKLEIKRYLKSFPWMIISAVMLFLIVAGITLTAVKMLEGTSIKNVNELVSNVTKEKSEKKEKLTVAIAVQDKSRAVKLAKSMLKNMKSVNSFLDIAYVGEEEGEEMLRRHQAVVMLVIREKTIAGIMDGTNVPVEVYFPEDSGYEAAIFKEFADAAVMMLSSSQASIYSVYDFYDIYGSRRERDKAIERMNRLTIAAVLGREDIYQQEEVLVTGQISVEQYYICSGLVLFAMFFAMIPAGHMKRANETMGARLKLAGTGYTKQVLAGLAGVFVSFLLLFFCVAVLVTLGKYRGIFSGEFVDGISYVQIWQMFVAIGLSTLCISAFALCICRLSEHALPQIMILFFSAVLQGLFCGCFVPQMLLPEAFEGIAQYLPAYQMIEVLKGIFLQKVSIRGIAGILVYTVVFFGITILWECRRSSGSRRRR